MRRFNFFYTFFLVAALSIQSGMCNHNLKKFPKGAKPEEVGTRLVKKYLVTPHSRFGNTRPEVPPTHITYPDVCTWLGSLWFANEIGNDELMTGLKERFEPILTTQKSMQPRPNHVDNNVFGSLPLELYKHFPKPEYRELGLKYADTQWTLPEDAKPEEKRWAEKGYSWQTRIWIDDMFMITAVQAQAYRVTGERKYIDRAAREMVMYLDTIQCPNGLFYHSPNTPFFWGRGNGWMAVGMAELLRILPEDNPDREAIMKGYLTMMFSLLKYQAQDGMWRQLIDDPGAWKETSGTAMFTYAMITGVQNGWLDKKVYGKAARKAWISMIKYIDENDEVTEVCEGTNIKNDRQYYLDRKRIVGDLHGQAPYIWCAYALMR